MGASPQFTEAMILARISEEPGTRFHVAKLAHAYKVSQASLRESLENLHRQGLIRRESGAVPLWFIPSAKEKTIEANAHKARPFKPLSAANMPNRDYDSRRAGSGDLLRVASKHV
jgi:DNA-binding FadR family transcriptional regulator